MRPLRKVEVGQHVTIYSGGDFDGNGIVVRTSAASRRALVETYDGIVVEAKYDELSDQDTTEE